jgi:hypothetical protein
VLFLEDLCSLMLEHLYAGTELCWVSRNRSGKDSARVWLWEQSGRTDLACLREIVGHDPDDLCDRHRRESSVTEMALQMLQNELEKIVERTAAFNIHR